MLYLHIYRTCLFNEKPHKLIWIDVELQMFKYGLALNFN